MKNTCLLLTFFMHNLKIHIKNRWMETHPLTLTESTIHSAELCVQHTCRVSLSLPRTHTNPPDAVKDFCSCVAGDNSQCGRDRVNEGSKCSYKKQQFYGACGLLIAVWTGWPLNSAGSSDQQTGLFRSGQVGTSEGCVCHSNMFKRYR